MTIKQRILKPYKAWKYRQELLDRLTDPTLIDRLETDNTITITINKLPNDQDWEFELLDYGNGKKGFAVF